MTPRELFETLWAKHQSVAGQYETALTQADIASHRVGDRYRAVFPELNAAWHWFKLGRETVVAVLPAEAKGADFKGQVVRPDVTINATISRISDVLFEQGINNVRSD